MICFVLVLWHMTPSKIFIVESCLYIYIKHVGFLLVGFYGISTIVGHLTPNPIYTYIKYIILNEYFIGKILK